jgi:hypothetical protein
MVFNLVSQAQGKYSTENLTRLSQEDLEIYLYKAQQQKQRGKTLAFIGAAAIVGEIVWASLDPNMHRFSSFSKVSIVGIAGFGAMILGIPMSISGNTKIARINKIDSTVNNDILFKIEPQAQYNIISRNYTPGVAVSITF